MKVIEQLLIDAGISPIAGVDEAGRGACAGPLVVAAVILKDPFHPDLAPVRDSKEIKESKREALFDLVIDHSLSYSIIEIPAAEVDSRGVHAANLDGMRRAVQALKVVPAYVLTDGYAIAGLALPQLALPQFWLRFTEIASCANSMRNIRLMVLPDIRAISLPAIPNC